MPTKVPEGTPLAYFDDERVSEPGFYLLEGDPEVDENATVHESGMTPGDRIFPSSDGEGFVYSDPSASDGEDD
jgi:hypothetical protein